MRGEIPTHLVASELRLMQLPQDVMGASPETAAALRKSTRHAKQLLRGQPGLGSGSVREIVASPNS